MTMPQLLARWNWMKEWCNAKGVDYLYRENWDAAAMAWAKAHENLK